MILRVGEPGTPGFQLRRSEAGLSVFDTQALEPPLTEAEILGIFRPGSFILTRSRAEIAAKGLLVVPIPGADPLPSRLLMPMRRFDRGQE